MEVSDRHRHDDPGSAGRRRLGGPRRSAGPDGREVDAGTLAEVLAILAVDLVSVLPVDDRAGVLERLANRLDGQSRTPGGRETAAMLGRVAEALMRLEG